MAGAEEQSKQLPYALLRPVWSRERLFLWQLRAATAQRGPRTAPWHSFLHTDPGQSHSQWEGAAGGGRGAGCAGLCPHRAEGLCPAPPRRLLAPHGALRGRAGRRAGPAVITLPAPWGHRGAPSRDRASLRAVRRAPSALLHNRRQRRGYTTNGGAAPARPRYRRREGTGPRLSPSAGLTPPPWRPLPRGHLRYLRRVRHPGAAGEQLPFLPFPPCLPPSLTPCPPPPHHRGAGCRRRAPSQPVPSLGSFSFRFFPFPSLPSPVFTPTPPTWK